MSRCLRHHYLGTEASRRAIRVTIAELPPSFILPLSGFIDGMWVSPVHTVGRLRQIGKLGRHHLNVAIAGDDVAGAQWSNVAHWGCMSRVGGYRGVAGPISTLDNHMRLARAQTVLFGLHDLHGLPIFWVDGKTVDDIAVGCLHT